MTNEVLKVAIVGRVNVGKSTLFNKLIGRTQAIVSPIPGTTRDRRYGICNWQNKEFLLIDTGGYIDRILLGKRKIKKLTAQQETEKIDKKVIEQTRQALDEADLVLLLVDFQTGIVPEDRKIVSLLEKINKKVILAVNKVDKAKERQEAEVFRNLGVGDPFPVSSVTGMGTGDLLDFVIKNLKFKKPKSSFAKASEDKEVIHVAIIGKPNVGKSSLLNAILGYERAIVSPVPHTTRESQGESVKYKENNFFFIDTAGIRKAPKIEKGIEQAGVNQAKSSINKADIVLFMTNVDERLSVQDSKIGARLVESGTGVVIIANKWDLIEDHSGHNQKSIIGFYQRFFPHLKWAPIVFLSAKTGFKVNQIYDLILEIKAEREKEIPDKALERFLSRIVKIQKPVKKGGIKRPRIYKFRQAGICPPTFEIVISKTGELADFYLNFVKNRLREKFGFLGTPIKIVIKKTRQ